MLGKTSGVAEKLVKKYPNTIPWLCMNYRIELAVSDSTNVLGAINHFQYFMDNLYSHFIENLLRTNKNVPMSLTYN